MSAIQIDSPPMPPPFEEPTHAQDPQAPQRSEAPRESAPPFAEPENPLRRLSAEQLEALGRELDALHEEVFADLGERDARYIRSTIRFHRQLVIAARLLLLRADKRPLWLMGTTALSLAKILENMEIGHNVMHGQWDWMNDPDINSRSWDWDTASPADAWRHSHNYEHHTFTNIRGKDRDLGYEIMRIDPHQRWHPVYLLQPLYNLLLMGFFEWGVALHDLNFEAIRKGEKPKAKALAELRAIGLKARRQAVKDYIAFPLLSAAVSAGSSALLSGRSSAARSGRGSVGSSADNPAAPSSRRAAARTFKATLTANFTSNIVRNVWAHSIIFCGHFPDQTYTFSEQEVAEETRGAWYVRQLLGSANIEGGRLFHFASGNLGFQVEHHLFPDIPSSRYAEIAPRVREICRRYNLPYNSGPLHRQLGAVHRTILRLAFPGGRPRPKVGGYDER
ncbi:MAG TPA: acyl-CoA desaturase [Solirubrobacteraceae bacterium]|jgi:fatty acid desaturase|nr:acyl-CoA desaturase [Solirubrobacteraceae bacterium]